MQIAVAGTAEEDVGDIADSQAVVPDAIVHGSSTPVAGAAQFFSDVDVFPCSDEAAAAAAAGAAIVDNRRSRSQPATAHQESHLPIHRPSSVRLYHLLAAV